MFLYIIQTHTCQTQGWMVIPRWCCVPLHYVAAISSDKITLKALLFIFLHLVSGGEAWNQHEINSNNKTSRYALWTAKHTFLLSPFEAYDWLIQNALSCKSISASLAQKLLSCFDTLNIQRLRKSGCAAHIWYLHVCKPATLVLAASIHLAGWLDWFIVSLWLTPLWT